jgi:nucleotide-binding universal stress UspA family protein
MSFTTLLVYVDAAELPDEHVRVAAALADKFNAMLVGLSTLAVTPPLFVAEGIAIDAAVEAEGKQFRATLDSKGKWFNSAAGATRRKVEWRSMLDIPNDALAREARCADLLVVRQHRSSLNAYRALDPGRAILSVGRPTLVVPEGVSTLRAEHVLIGWKDRREARRAIQDALPFLHEANRVTIMEICGGGEEETARKHVDDVAQYLARHRITAAPRVMTHRGGSGAKALIETAQQEGADLLVTGAYGHTRLGEWIFGGVTHDLLEISPICCLMAH